jgi:hypothetical protein
MGSKFRQKTGFFLFWPAVLMYLVTSCVSAGSPNLSVNNTEKIINGKTTKSEIVEVLGEPEQILKLDKEGLENYLSLVAASDAPPLGFAEDHYEVWIYNSWSHAAGLVLTPSYEEAKLCLIVIDSKGVCAEKYYTKENSLKF